MIEEIAFTKTVKVVTRSCGVSNDPADARGVYEVDSMTPASARILLLINTRFVTSGNATFLVGKPAVVWGNVEFDWTADTDMQFDGIEGSEIWIS